MPTPRGTSEADEARQGYRSGHVRPILFISTALAIIGLTIVGFSSGWI